MTRPALTEAPKSTPRTYLDFPLALDLDALEADIAVLGIPCGLPYYPAELANDQSTAPDILRGSVGHSGFDREHHDFDLGGPLLDGRDVRVVDCGNVTSDRADPRAHYARAEEAARKIFAQNAVLIALGGDHGIPIPVFRALEELGQKITLIQIDAHMDWRDEREGEPDGYSSQMRRASEMPWIGHIVQIGIRGAGSARAEEINAALDRGVDVITAYEMHEIGMQAVLDRIPDGGPYYVTFDADGMDPTIMPGVMAQCPGGLNWLQLRQFVHGLVVKGRVVGIDISEIAPARDVGGITMTHAHRLLCNFIGASVRAGYYG